MSPNPLPDFQHVLLLSHGDLNAADLSECHGVLCGMICGENGQTANGFLAHLDSLELAVESGTSFHDVMVEAFQSTTEQLADDELRFNLWLPDDEEPLEERTSSLAQWCTGFLAGLGLGGPMQPLSEEAAEALEDLRQIAGTGFSADDGDIEEIAQEEENEQAFFEIVEYVRVVTLVLREEMRGPKADDPIH